MTSPVRAAFDAIWELAKETSSISQEEAFEIFSAGYSAGVQSNTSVVTVTREQYEQMKKAYEGGGNV